MDPPEHALVLCVDEKSKIQSLNRTAPCLPLLPTIAARHSHDYVRSGTASLSAALDTAAGNVTTSMHRHHQEFLKFLKTIDAATPVGLDLHLICDSYATHKTPQVRSWLLHHPRFTVHFTPTGSSWLNLAERWFAESANRKLRRSSHRGVRELEADTRAWADAWNENPRPFVWTRTADEVLDSIASYLQLINDSEHQ